MTIMTNKGLKEIKEKMKELYIVLIDRNDQSYNEMYEALYTMHALNVINDDQWHDIVEYDKKLFKEIEQEWRY